MRHILLHCTLGLMPLHLQHELSGQCGGRGSSISQDAHVHPVLLFTGHMWKGCIFEGKNDRASGLRVALTLLTMRSLFSHHIFPEKSFFQEWLWSDLKRDCGHMIQKIIPLPWFSASIGGHIFSISIHNSSSPKAQMRGSSTPYWDDFMEQKFLI